MPGLGELPVVGRLFSHSRTRSKRTEIVLLITPRLVRTLARPDASSVEFAAGTEASSGAPRLPGSAVPSIPPPGAVSEEPAAVPQTAAGRRRSSCPLAASSPRPQ